MVYQIIIIDDSLIKIMVDVKIIHSRINEYLDNMGLWNLREIND